MFKGVTDRARKVIALAQQEAQRLNHQHLGSGHLLLGLMKEGSGIGVSILKGLGVDLRQALDEIEQQMKAEPAERMPSSIEVMHGAFVEAQTLHRTHIGTEHLLLGLLRQRDGVAVQVLRRFGVDLARARTEVRRLLGDTTPDPLAGCPMCRTIDHVRSSPAFIAELTASYAVLGVNQGCPGWCVLLLKDHHEHLDDLPPPHQLDVFEDAIRIARSIREIFPTSGKDGLPPRINYECLGNLVPHIHWHIIPRHADDPEPTKPVWGWPDAQLKGSMSPEERAALIARLRAAL